MRAYPLRFSACLLALLALFLGACSSKDKASTMPDMPESMAKEPERLSNSAVTGKYGPRATYRGKNVSTVRGDLETIDRDQLFRAMAQLDAIRKETQ